MSFGYYSGIHCTPLSSESAVTFGPAVTRCRSDCGICC